MAETKVPQPLSLSDILGRLELTDEQRSTALAIMQQVADEIYEMVNAPDDAIMLVLYPKEGWKVGLEWCGNCHPTRRPSTVDMLVPADGPSAPGDKGFRKFTLKG
jgi:hypothetical protein